MFYLRQYNKTILTFEIEEDDLLGQTVRIVDGPVPEVMFLLPIGVEANAESLKSWLKKRIIPKNRAFVDAFLAKQGLSHGDLKGILQVCKGLSLNDSYWVTDVEDDLFEDYNLYENDFRKALALIAYTGYGSSTAKGFTSSPEFTTTGMLRKGWRRLKGKIILYKGGTSGFANAGKEPYSEFYASQIAERMGLNHVEYNLSKWKGCLCSTCELFSDINHSFVPIYNFVDEHDIKSVASYIKQLGSKYYDEFVDMLIFDALIYNEDRHLGNFGIMVDNKTNSPCSFAPIFDNGLSLFNYAMDDDFDDLDSYAKTRLSAYGVPFENIVKEFITPRQKAKLRRLIGFTFARGKTYNLPEKQLKAIERHLQQRVSELLSM